MSWYLNRRMAELSCSLKNLQEERLNRKREEKRTLSGNASKELLEIKLLGLKNPDVRRKQSLTSDSLPGKSIIPLAISSVENGGYDDVITQDQSSQFDLECLSTLQSLKSDRETVLQAESRLQEISSLQTELISHLSHQTDVTDRLYNDVVMASSSVFRGNVELAKARTRTQTGRFYTLAFLLCASLALLFLHFYD
jgi:syntaxin 18